MLGVTHHSPSWEREEVREEREGMFDKVRKRIGEEGEGEGRGKVLFEEGEGEGRGKGAV